MHELSVARALFDLVRRYAPPGACVRNVRVRIGPTQAIVPEALRYAWQAATNQTTLDGAELALEFLPWRLSCSVCKRQWNSDEPYAPCACGFDKPALSGSDALTLLAIDVDDLVESGATLIEKPPESQESVR